MVHDLHAQLHDAVLLLDDFHAVEVRSHARLTHRLPTVRKLSGHEEEFVRDVALGVIALQGS